MPLLGMTNFAKARHLRWAPQDMHYPQDTVLKPGAFYNIAFEIVGTEYTIYHEVLALTGSNELLLVDPDFGVFHIWATTPDTYRATIETELFRLHHSDGIVGNFQYKRARKAF